MVLGFLRRRRGGGSPAAQGSQIGPKGQMTEKCYIPAPGEVEAAEPVPPLFGWEDPLEVLSEEEYGWVLVNKDSWKPRGRKGVEAALLCEPVRLEGYEVPFDALAWTPEGKIYLLDIHSYALLYQSEGKKTARDIVEHELTLVIERMPDDFPVKKAILKDEEEKTEEDRNLVFGFIAAYYAQFAILRKYGLIT